MSCYAIRANECIGTGSEYIMGSTIPQLLDDLARVMRENPDIVREANAVYEFTVHGQGTWTIDATVPGGIVREGRAQNPDCTFALSEETLKGLMDHTLSAKWALATRRLRVSNIPAAMRLAEIIRRVKREG
ncbi:MAG: SCP2 sterol-binding domain-containing protein [Myxococcota bacterium]|nr:SCP2 sterol-binding domain-containing protein [Myxococcota bacterium]